MKMDRNDPRWTAYALGEIEDETMRAEIENQLRESESMRRFVEDIRRAAAWLREGFDAEPRLGLSGEQRGRIASRAAPRRAWFRANPAWALGGAAAALALGLSFWAYQMRDNAAEPASGGTPIAEMRKGGPARPEPVPEVTIPAQSLTVIDREYAPAPAPAEPRPAAVETARNEQEASAAAEGILTESSPTSGTVLRHREVLDLPLIDKDVPERVKIGPPPAAEEKAAERIFTESSPSAGTDLSHQEVFSLPLIDNDVLELADIHGGVTPPTDHKFRTGPSFAGVDSRALNITQDGITINDVHYKAGIPSSGPFQTEGYDPVADNAFLEAARNPLSTFSIDVDTASYSNVRRFLEQNRLPPRDAVRIEELVNYFEYGYSGPGGEGPFAVHFEMTEAPWNPEHRLLRIGLKAEEIEPGARPPAGLVFLIDVSGSMTAPNKLPLVKEAMHMLVDQMTGSDRISLVTYAGSTRVVLAPTGGGEKRRLHRAIDSLCAGGSTAGASGIELAYATARGHYVDGGVNRVILATDGDFNVGTTSRGELARLIEEKAESGVFLSVLGFGMGNYKDDTLELLAGKGRGNYAYIDTAAEAKKVLVDSIGATLVSVAKDVKIQVEFNPARAGAYRLIGYENRVLAGEDFNDDAKKAGVIGAGHAVTALYEIVPPGLPGAAPGVDPLKYQQPAEPTRAASGSEVATVKIRYKGPEEEQSRLMEFAVRDSGGKFGASSEDFKFAASVAAFGMILRESPHRGSATLEDALRWAEQGRGEDRHGYRDEYIRLLHRAMSIKRPTP